MSSLEKLYSVLAIIYITGLAALLLLFPWARQMTYLLPLSLLGVGVNVGLLFVVFRDILNRSFPSPWKKYFWVITVFLFLPAVIIYLPLHGFKKR